MNWFKDLVGFEEEEYLRTQAQLGVCNGFLTVKGQNTPYRVGQFELLTLSELRQQSSSIEKGQGTSSIAIVVGDVKELHALPKNRHAIFQVASQFNCLEMVSSNISPEDGVTRYQSDRTQGPACAISAGAATLYRNYLVRHGQFVGQTKNNQIDTSWNLRQQLASDLGWEVDALWTMKNGYAFFTLASLKRLAQHLETALPEQIDIYRGLLQIGIHEDVSITLPMTKNDGLVTQIFCSALPISYNNLMQGPWSPIASLVLESAYESTLLAATIQKKRTGVDRVLLTLLGGGAFGNDPRWIYEAIKRAFNIVKDAGLNIEIVSYGQPDSMLKHFVHELNN